MAISPKMDIDYYRFRTDDEGDGDSTEGEYYIDCICLPVPITLTSNTFSEYGVDGENALHILGMEIQVEDSQNSLTISANCASNYTDLDTFTGNASASPRWVAYSSGEKILRPVRNKTYMWYEDTRFTDSKFPPAFYAARFDIGYDHGETAEYLYVYNIMLTQQHYDDYSGHDCEPFESNTPANILYSPDYPVSAWHVRNVLMANMNKMMYQSRVEIDIPVFGYCHYTGGPT